MQLIDLMLLNDDDKNIYTVKVILRFPPTPLPCYADGRINKKKKKAKKQIFYKNRFPSLFSIALCCAIVWCYAEIFPKLFHLINRKTFFRFCLPENWFVSWEARKFECSTTSKVINRIEKESRDQTEKKKTGEAMHSFAQRRQSPACT